MGALARTEFSSALNALAAESGLDPKIVLETIKQAILAAYRRDVRERHGEQESLSEEDESKKYEVILDPESGEARVLSWEEGDEKKKEDVTPPGFGRIAVQTAKQVIIQKIREAEKDAVMGQYQSKIGSLVTGIVLRFDGPNVRIDLGRTEGLLPSVERIQNEKFNLNQRLTFLLKDIRETEKGKEIILSRADPEIVKKMFAREVPEIASGAVEIKAIARDPGHRTKIAVASTQSGVDPVGSAVGQKGVRVQAVINELNQEKIDVIPWTDNEEELIAAALSPASGTTVTLSKKEKEAKVKLPEDQLSLAIGRDGGNVRLASKLTGWKIEVEGEKNVQTRKKEEQPSETKVTNKFQPESAKEKVEKKETVISEDTRPGSLSNTGDNNSQATKKKKIKG